jgi:hypothetical protein
VVLGRAGGVFLLVFWRIRFQAVTFGRKPEEAKGEDSARLRIQKLLRVIAMLGWQGRLLISEASLVLLLFFVILETIQNYSLVYAFMQGNTLS